MLKKSDFFLERDYEEEEAKIMNNFSLNMFME